MIVGEDNKSYMQRLCRFAVHLISWGVCLASIVLGAGAVYYLSEVRGNICCAAQQDTFHAHMSSYKGL